MAEHTPTPWSACKEGDCQCGYIFGDSGQTYVAQTIGPKNVDEMGCPDPHPFLKEQLINTKFIVRAVNCHDELVAALEFYAAKQSYVAIRGGKCVVLEDCGDRARAILAKAKGE